MEGEEKKKTMRKMGRGAEIRANTERSSVLLS
jgi:hypothetical protein